MNAKQRLDTYFADDLDPETAAFHSSNSPCKVIEGKRATGTSTALIVETLEQVDKLKLESAMILHIMPTYRHADHYFEQFKEYVVELIGHRRSAPEMLTGVTTQGNRWELRFESEGNYDKGRGLRPDILTFDECDQSGINEWWDHMGYRAKAVLVSRKADNRFEVFTKLTQEGHVLK